MPRSEQRLMEGWEFALGEPKEENYRKVVLPHDWAVEAPFNRYMEAGESQGFRDRFNTGWYRRTLPVKKREGYRYYLDFGGIYEDSSVWVNGKPAGGHHYGYSSFRLDVTDLVRDGENIILVKADNTKRPADRWLSPAGIYRTVKWIETEENHLDEREITVRTRMDGGAAVIAVGTGGRGPVKAVLSDADTELCEESADGRIIFSLENPKLWSAETPDLYTLTLHIMAGGRETDQISMRIGIRDITMDAQHGMMVNGKKVILKGVCVHQEVGCRGNAAKKELWRERLLLLKKAGCNAIRAAHHTFSSEFLDLCDETGFYVYEECFDKWTGGLYGRYFEEDWQTDLACMVERDRNHPSIFIWGVGNEVENQAQDSMVEILKKLVERVKAMDPARPVTYAMNPHFKRESHVDMKSVTDIQKFVDEADDTEIYDLDERIGRIKRIAENVDVISCNYQEQWYEKIHEAIPDKLILGTEVYQFFKGYKEQMQNFTCENPSLVPFEENYVIGSMIWTGFDYLGESMGYPAKGWSGALIRTNLVPRPGFYIMQSYWSDEAMVHFSVMDYSLQDEGVKEHWDMPIYADHWHFPQFHKAVIPYMIASNCEEVTLCLNDKQFYLPKPCDCPNRVITGFLPYQPGTVKVVGYKNGEAVCSHVTVTPGPACRLAFEQEEVTVSAEEGYELLLTVKAVDESGIPVFRESAAVNFTVEGDGRILAVDNGNLMGSETYQESSVHMYRGCASVVIRLNGGPGRTVVSAWADGLCPGRTVIRAV